jgi:hypothetical protein
VAVQSTQSTPPIPQAEAVVPLLQFKPVSQHPVHWGHGPLPPDDEEVDVELVVDVVDVDDDDDDLEAIDDDVVARELDAEVVLARDAVLLEPGMAEVVVEPPEAPTEVV